MALNKNVAKGIKTRQENELLENNKLIAEFMGNKAKDGVYVYQAGHQMPKHNFPNIAWTIREASLLYHTSWDWLMLVVEKIGKLEDDNSDMQTYARYEYVTKLPITASREVVYKAVVKFIKWYNSKGVYPFNEGDDYWTIEDGDVVRSCWDFVSEELYDENPNKKLFKTKQEAIDSLKNNK